MPAVKLENICRNFDRIWAVEEVDLTIADGEFLTLLGPSGCGKTTTLRMVAGFLFPSQGRIVIGNQDVTRLPPNERDTGMVFQSYALFPHLSVAQNVGFGLKMRGVRGAEAQRRVREALELVQLGSFADRLPGQLSGGQQQRVALARAVVIRPQVLLMDEPLGALDLKLRQGLQVQIRNVQREVGITTIYVTHDQGEALSLSDRVAVMSGGRIAQLDTPEKLYTRPSNAFVANFVGRTNLLPVEIVADIPGGMTHKARLVGSDAEPIIVPCPVDGEVKPGARYLLGFRPESSSIGNGGPNAIAARVDDVRFFGSTRSVVLTNALGGSIEVDLPAGTPVPRPAEQVSVRWNPVDSFLLNHDSPAA
jgi:ABC-type Fe3+/spermidine/putrescine transport system ATPase subunit